MQVVHIVTNVLELVITIHNILQKVDHFPLCSEWSHYRVSSKRAQCPDVSYDNTIGTLDLVASK